MAYNGIQQNVIDKTSKYVLRHGHQDYASGSQFDSENEEIVEKDFVFDPPIYEMVWKWNSVAETFEQVESKLPPAEPYNPDSGAKQVFIREVEGTLYGVKVYFTTGDSNSLDCANDPAFFIDTSVSGKTRIIFNPVYSYYIDKGVVRAIAGLPDIAVKAAVIMAQDTAYEHPFLRNCRFCSDDPDMKQHEENSPSKRIQYIQGLEVFSSAVLELTHDADESQRFEYYLRIYKI